MFGEGTRLTAPWRCPEPDCNFTTDVKRARAGHLLRVHHLLFKGLKEPIPLHGKELQERLEAFRRRNRGSKQRARENRRLAAFSATVGGESPTPARSADQVAGSVADPDLLPEEDWGAAVIELLLDEDLEPFSPDEDGQDRQLVPYTSPPAEDLDEELLPHGIPPTEFASKVAGWRGLTLDHMVMKAQAEWGIGGVDLPRLRMAVKLVVAARVGTAFGLLEAVQPLLPTTSAPEICRRMVEEIVILATGQ